MDLIIQLSIQVSISQQTWKYLLTFLILKLPARSCSSLVGRHTDATAPPLGRGREWGWYDEWRRRARIRRRCISRFRYRWAHQGSSWRQTHPGRAKRAIARSAKGENSDLCVKKFPYLCNILLGIEGRSSAVPRRHQGDGKWQDPSRECAPRTRQVQDVARDPQG